MRRRRGRACAGSAPGAGGRADCGSCWSATSPGRRWKRWPGGWPRNVEGNPCSARSGRGGGWTLWQLDVEHAAFAGFAAGHEPDLAAMPLDDSFADGEAQSEATEHGAVGASEALEDQRLDRKSTRLNSSHSQISYAVFCLKK